MKFFMTIIAFLLAISVLWAGGVEPHVISIEKISIPISAQKLDLEDVSFVQISDIHFRRFGIREQKLLTELKEIGPDYLFITGDLVDWSTKITEEFRQFLNDLAGITRQKTFLIYGNHEHRNPKMTEIGKIFEESGLRILKNENLILNEGIYLAGVDDPHLGFDNLDLALAGIPQNAPKILLAHSPEIFEKVKTENILVLAGHTHGAQINIPFLAERILPLKNEAIHYKRGLFGGENLKWLYVNRGIGCTFLPFRFNSLPEITVIMIK
jgi:uncharacterized protein